MKKHLQCTECNAVIKQFDENVRKGVCPFSFNKWTDMLLKI